MAAESRRMLPAGRRVTYGPDQQRATITRVRAAGPDAADRRVGAGPFEYDLHLDSGADLTGVPDSEVTAISLTEVLERLGKRYSSGGTHFNDGDAVRAVALAEFLASYNAEHPDARVDRPVPTLDDDLDALSLVAGYRQAVDHDELRLIEAARAKGATWEQIGLALGSPLRSAKQRARGRWKALGGKPTEAPSPTPEGQPQ